MTKPLFFENLAVGDRWQSRARTITETDVVNFAGITGDYDPLHVDHEYARQSPFGKPIAHGILGLAFVAGLGSNFPAVNSIAFVGIRNWEFLKPAFIGDTVHAVNEIVKLTDKGRKRGLVTWHRQLINQNAEVIQQGIFETLVAKSTERIARVDRAEIERTNAKPHAPPRKRSRKKKLAE